TPVLPIAHNAGYLWGRNAFIKKPGTITVRIGKPVDAAGLKPNDLNSKVEHWIRDEMNQMGKP
ncbi:MAG TPA: 1-acyl-sn-glycerol-3-phosphate acyltransferase, partial [Burkholderiales bacterium]|nr:1-acyl-sn-glycerol-3-phosphate acyltransferase [Burkholderiales bacterium]